MHFNHMRVRDRYLSDLLVGADLSQGEKEEINIRYGVIALDDMLRD